MVTHTHAGTHPTKKSMLLQNEGVKKMQKGSTGRHSNDLLPPQPVQTLFKFVMAFECFMAYEQNVTLFI